MNIYGLGMACYGGHTSLVTQWPALHRDGVVTMSILVMAYEINYKLLCE